MTSTANRSRAPSLLQAIRRRASGRVRVAVLAIFALAIATQSLLGVLGGIHEATAPAHAMHGMTDHLAPHDHAAAVKDGTDADEGGPLHVLLHFMHCCNHSAWMSGGDSAITVMIPLCADSSIDRATLLPAPDRIAPFRPPIAV
jgi:hypothetical protein